MFHLQTSKRKRKCYTFTEAYKYLRDSDIPEEEKVEMLNQASAILQSSAHDFDFKRYYERLFNSLRNKQPV
jgi:hypothetical protein